MEIKRGKLIVIEGTDCSGKETQTKKIIERLNSMGIKSEEMSFPRYDTPTGAIVGECYLGKELKHKGDGSWFGDADSVDPKVASLYYAADRRDARDIINKKLDMGINVICNRYVESNMGHQGGKIKDPEKRKEFFKWLENLEYELLGLPRPDSVLFLFMPFEIGMELHKKRINPLNVVDHGGHEDNIDHLINAENSYLQLAQIYNWTKIDCARSRNISSIKSVDEIHDEILWKLVEMGIVPMQKRKYNSIKEVPFFIRKKLDKYFTNVGGNVFVIQNLPSELTGGALARYSRSPTGMQLTIINEFFDENGNPSQEKGSELMDRVLNAYGDESVGELEGTHVGIENVSMIAIKAIEDRRIGGSPIEQSTRYVKYDILDENGKWKYLRPKEIIDSGLIDIYEKVNNRAFEVYSELVTKLQDYFKKQLPENEFEIEVTRNGVKQKAKKHELIADDEIKAFNTSYSFTIRCAALDTGRCVLPSSTLSQLGIFGNGRFYTKLLTTLKSSELDEERSIGIALENELKKAIPTFIKWNRDDPLLFRERNRKLREIASQIFSGIIPETKGVCLAQRGEYLDEILTNAIIPHTHVSFNQALKEIRKLSYKEKIELLKIYIGKRETRRDRTPRGFEAGYPITFDLVGTFAEFRDLHRHRMLTQQRQLLTTELGFLMPAEIAEVRMEEKVEEVVQMMEELHKELKRRGYTVASQYATLFNHRVRFIMGMNIRELQHFTELRTIPQGHHGYRAMSMEMARELIKRDEWAELALQFVNYSDPGNKIARAKEQSRIAGDYLARGIDGSIDL